MAIQRWNRRDRERPGQRNQGPKNNGPARPRSAPAPPAGKRKCPNCGEEHAALKCPRPAVAVSERKCWECNEAGHVSRDCKKRQGRNAIRAIEDRQGGLNGFFAVEEDGFTKVATGRRGRRATRPMPSTPCLGNFFSKNSWEALTEKNEQHDEGNVTKMKEIVEATGASTPAASAPAPRSGALSKDSPDPLEAFPRLPRVQKPERDVKKIQDKVPKTEKATRAMGTSASAVSTSSSTSSPTTTSCDVPGGMGLPAEEAHPPKRRGLGFSSTGSASTTLDCSLRRSLTEAQEIMNAEDVHRVDHQVHGGPGEHPIPGIPADLNCIENEVDDDSIIAATTEKVRVRVAADSGAVANVINPGSLPSDAKPTPNADDTHFVGAGGGRIRKYGTYTSKLESEHGAVGCNWQVADVIRPLHSISTIAGPEEGPGLQDVLFNNKRCVVVPPGVVERILKEIQPIAQYDRCGNLYIAEMEMSSFGRRGQES